MKLLQFLSKRFFLVANGFITALFLLACAAPYINPAHYWPFAFLGLAFPFICLVEIGFLLLWLLFDRKWCLLSFIALLIGWKQLSVIFAWNLHPGKVNLPENNLRIMSYNVHYFDPYNDQPDKENRVRNEMLELIGRQHADVLCLQEFFTSENPKRFDIKSYISDSLHFPYRYFSSDYNYGFSNNHSGVILFSRYPILHAEKIKLQDRQNSERAVYADILRGADTIRIYTMHLQSIYLNKKDLAALRRMRETEDSGLVVSRTVIGKLKRAFVRRGNEVERVAGLLHQSPYPVVVCGDFNDTPVSYTYFKLRGTLQDAFLKKGFGFGATYISISPTLRIDYILPDDRWQVNNFYRIPEKLSDHYPVVADISLKSP